MKAKALFRTLFLVLLMTTLAVAGNVKTTTALANPSTGYCSDMGYIYKTLTADGGGEYGACQDMTGYSCDAWDFYCKCSDEASSYCSDNMIAAAADCNLACVNPGPCRDEGSACTLSTTACCDGLVAVSNSFPEGDACIASNCGSICRPCGDGVCADNENTCNCPEDCATTTTCTDTDGGKNYYAYGETTGYTSGVGDVYTSKDMCLRDGVNDANLQETWCENNEVKVGIYNCLYGCEDGACIEKSDNYCDESDNGKDYYTKGWARDHGEYAESWDECIDGSTLREQYCTEDVSSYASVHFRTSIDYTCPNGCDNGACIQDSVRKCTDSDGGRDYYEKGTTSSCTTTSYNDVGCELHMDACNDNYQLTEYYCSGDEVQRESYTCPNGCDNGACIRESSGCTDSDGGKNHYTKGYIECPDGSCSKTWDYCAKSSVDLPGTTNSGTYLYEMWCNEYGYPQMEFHTCDNGCVDGACIRSEATCKDSDGGKEYYIKGVTTLSTGQKHTDSCTYCTGDCTSPGDCPPVECFGVIEYYCDGNGITGTNYDCPNGCVDGACVRDIPQKCTDSDNGIDYYEKGYVIWDGMRYHDACVESYDEAGNLQYSSGMLVEVYCTDEGVARKEYQCPNGCADGACNREPPQENKFRNAYWQCYDGTDFYEGGPTSCKSTATWKEYAVKACAHKCNVYVDSTNAGSDIGVVKCGVNTFEVWNPCTDVFDCHRDLGKEKCEAAGGKYVVMECYGCGPYCQCKEDIVYCEESPYEPDCVCRNGERVPVYDDYPCDGNICPMIAVRVRYKCVDKEFVKTRIGESFKLMPDWTAIVTDYNEMHVKLKYISPDALVHTTTSSGGGAGGYADANVVNEETVTTEIMPYPTDGYYATLVITMPGQKQLLEAHTETQAAIATITGNVVADSSSMPEEIMSASVVLRLKEGESGSAFGTKVTALTVNKDVAVFIIHREDIIICPEYYRCDDGTIKQCWQEGDECICEACEEERVCESTVCPDGTVTECYLDDRGNCICTLCESIEEPICGNGICEDGEGIVCRNICKHQPDGREICEYEKVCYIVCPEDCSNEPPTDCDGCVMGTRCLPYGTRRLIEDTSVFCGLDGDWNKQLSEGDKCQNSYECKTNTCTSGKCFDLEGELKETQGLLKRILSWLEKLFG